MLYLSLDMPPHAVFLHSTCGGTSVIFKKRPPNSLCMELISLDNNTNMMLAIASRN